MTFNREVNQLIVYLFQVKCKYYSPFHLVVISSKLADARGNWISVCAHVNTVCEVLTLVSVARA